MAALAGKTLALTPCILAEFVHVVTDARRFSQPLTMADATRLAAFWSEATEVQLLPQDIPVTRQWLEWLVQHQLGRKRLLDTLIASTWHCAGITEIYTLNPKDFVIFGQFTALP